jgi:hypothetical protein
MPMTKSFVAACLCQAALLVGATLTRSAHAQGASAEAIAHNPSLAGPRPSSAAEESSTDEPLTKGKQRPRKLSGFVFRPFAVAMGLGGGGLVLPEEVHARELVGGVGAGQFDFRVAFLYALFVDMGFALGNPADHGSFSEIACPQFGGECDSYDSSIAGVMPFIKTGLLQRLFLPLGRNAWQATFVAGVGHRGISLTRSIENCVDCTSQDLNVNGGYFVSPELDLSYAVNDPGVVLALGLKLEYEHYLSGDIRSGTWLSAFVEFM